MKTLTLWTQTDNYPNFFLPHYVKVSASRGCCYSPQLIFNAQVTITIVVVVIINLRGILKGARTLCSFSHKHWTKTDFNFFASFSRVEARAQFSSVFTFSSFLFFLLPRSNSAFECGSCVRERKPKNRRLNRSLPVPFHFEDSIFFAKDFWIFNSFVARDLFSLSPSECLFVLLSQQSICVSMFGNLSVFVSWHSILFHFWNYIRRKESAF